MFNFLMSYSPESWDKGIYEYPIDRYLEDTDERIRTKFKDLSVPVLEELKKLPTLFMVEGEEKESRVGYVENIKIRSKSLYIEFSLDPILPPIPKGALKELEKPFDIGRWGLHRTRWALKDADLFFELARANFITEAQSEAAQFLRKNKLGSLRKQNHIDAMNNDHVFIVHGHDEAAKTQAADFVKSIGLIPIILHQQANQGMTIIEKIETYTNVGFAIVLYTPCDLGNEKNKINERLNPRARQNVVLEHGYLMAKLGRSRVAALVKGSVETPNDISGVVYIGLDVNNNWKDELRRELTVAGVSIK